MLDFYKITDDTPKPCWPEKIGLIKVEGLELDDFKDLANKNLIPDGTEFWSDFRWDKNTVLGIYNSVLENHPELKENKLRIKSVNKLFRILNSAVEDGIGLIAYCD